MGAFSFHPELFELRTEAMSALSDAGFKWLRNHSAIDLVHDLYGLEVLGVQERTDAKATIRPC